MEPRFTYIWEYRVRPESIDRFLRLYGPSGDWVRLFREAIGYVRTELHQDINDSNRYVTVDYWTSETAYNDFRDEFASQFEEIDTMGDELTESETYLGGFSILSR